MLLRLFVRMSSITMKRFPVNFSLSAGACIYGSVLLLTLPLKLLLAVCAAAAIHELGHLVMLTIFRIPILGVHLRIGGAVIHTPPLFPFQELLCTVAGPLSSLLCLIWIHKFPLFALCALAQGFFNLLPVYPLDGGRVLRSLCLLCIPGYAGFVCAIAKWCTVISLCVISVLISYRTEENFFILAALYFLLQAGINRKCP